MKDWLIAWKDAAPAAGAYIAVATGLIGLLVFRYTRLANRRRATLDMIMATLMNEHVQIRYNKFKAILRKDQDTLDCFKLCSLLDHSAVGTNDRTEMLHQLNVYELMALGIRRKLFDEAFYKRWYHNQFMQDFEGSHEFVKGIQDKKRSIFCESLWLYQKWLKDGHPEVSPNRFVMAWWAFRRKHDKIDAARDQAKAR